MTDFRDRGDDVGRLFERAARPAPTGARTADCLDAETLAAWIDGGLDAAALARAEAHAASCARCRAAAAALVMAMPDATSAERPAPAPVTAMPARPVRRWMPYVLPLAAAATIALAVVISRPGTPEPVPDSLQANRTEAERPTEAPAERLAQAPAAAEPAKPAAASADTRQSGAAGARSASGAEVPPTVTTETKAVAAPPPPTAGARAAAEAPTFRAATSQRDEAAPVVTIAVRESAVRWRTAGATIERSADAGTTWSPVPAGPDVRPVAGSAPSDLVCWLVGRDGLVLLTTDGRTWTRLAFPDATDLSAITATSAREAVVTTADGRRFRTTDGGSTWIRDPLQGIPALPFYE